MKHVKGPMSFTVFLLSLWLLATFTFSCNSSRTVDPTELRPFYRLGGVAVTICDPVRDTLGKMPVGTVAITELTRNDSVYPDALVEIDTFALVDTDSTYLYYDTSCTIFSAGDYDLKLLDGDKLDIEVPVEFADTFTVEITRPANRIANGNENVSLDWAGSAGSEGYIIAAVLRDSVGTGFGYSAYVTPLSTFATFPTEAFYQSGFNQPDTGWYYLYVFSYTGIPDSSLAEPFLPMSLPSQLPGLSYEARDFEARFGTVRVARHDSVQVVLLGLGE